MGRLLRDWKAKVKVKGTESDFRYPTVVASSEEEAKEQATRYCLNELKVDVEVIEVEPVKDSIFVMWIN